MESEHLERATPDDRSGLVGAVAPTRTPRNGLVLAKRFLISASTGMCERAHSIFFIP